MIQGKLLSQKCSHDGDTCSLDTTYRLQRTTAECAAVKAEFNRLIDLKVKQLQEIDINADVASLLAMKK